MSWRARLLAFGAVLVLVLAGTAGY
ncbi:MAG: hypothetical protein JWO63_3194, partial [Frankiales bacterium]|nr:hypothetical protein [Frankiales bacterium]